MTHQRTILFLCDDPNDLGGIQRVMATLVDQFRYLGYRIVITSLLQRAGDGFVDPAVERVQLFSEGPLTRFVQGLSLGPLHVRGRRLMRMRKLAQIAARAKLRRQVRDLKPDAVIIFDSFMAKLATESRLTGTKLLIQYHNSFSSLSSTADFSRLHKASQRASAFLALTAEDAESFRRAGFARADYVSNPVSFYPEHLPAERPHRVIALGRYHYQKAFDQLVEAWAAVPRKTNWRLDIFGEGPERGPIKDKVKSLDVADSVIVHPPTRMVQDLLEQSAIFALSSRFEGLCMVALEAIACGVPIVSTRSGPGTEELVRGCGLLSDVGDVPALAINLQRMIDDSSLRRTFSEAGRIKAKGYTVDHLVQKWEHIIAISPLVVKGLVMDCNPKSA